MKRIVIFLMTFLACITLFGCNSKENKKINENEQTEENENKDEQTNNSQLVKIDIETNNDVKNIISFINNADNLKMTYIMDNKIRSIQSGESSFYMCEINEEQYEIICAYINENEYEDERFRTADYYSKALWYKCTNKDSVKDSIDGLKLTGIFISYDAVITKDVINQKNMNLKCKYYNKIDERIGEPYIIPDDFKPKYKSLIIWDFKDYIENDNYYFNDYIFKLGYELRSNIGGLYRVVFNKVTSVSSGKTQNFIDKQFGESYQYFLEWLTDEEDFEKIDYSTDYLEYYETHEKVSINLEKFIELIKEITLNY